MSIPSKMVQAMRRSAEEWLSFESGFRLFTGLAFETQLAAGIAAHLAGIAIRTWVLLHAPIVLGDIDQTFDVRDADECHTMPIGTGS